MPKEKETELYIGIMTGTSVDAIDISLVDFAGESIRIIGSQSTPISKALKHKINTLFQPGLNEIDQLGQIDIELATLYAKSIKDLLSDCSVDTSQIVAIGSHGQTIRHRPELTDSAASHPFTLQIGDAHTLATKTNISVVNDFRKKDIALGGQGAPLAPAFHAQLVRGATGATAILNIGGIANISVISDTSVLGFDTGPGNGLLDSWIQEKKHQAYDSSGNWASQGQIIQGLLEQLLRHPYFQKPYPKSTGKEVFTLTWLNGELLKYEHHLGDSLRAIDVQSTLTALTARTISDAIKSFDFLTDVYICGGGIHNSYLIERIKSGLPSCKIASTSELGLDPEWVESVAFAWLARQHVKGLPGNIPSVTGASKACILGSFTPAG